MHDTVKRAEPLEQAPDLPHCHLRVATAERNLFRCRHTGVHAPGHLVTSEVCATCTLLATTCPQPRSIEERPPGLPNSLTFVDVAKPVPVPDHVAIVTSHFNPARFRKPARNYWQFRYGLGEELAKRLMTIELSFDGHYMVHDAIRVQGGPRNLVWQKEALLNLAFQQLPESVRYVAWINHDILFHNNEWAVHMVRALSEEHAVVQLFDHVDYLDQLGNVARSAPAMSWNLITNGHAAGMPGMAWGARRDYLETCGGLPAANIIGGGDVPAFDGFCDRDTVYYKRQCNESLNRANQAWIDRARRSRGRLKYGCVPGRVSHLWHGRSQDRRYRSRMELIRDCDVESDIHLNADGIWEWTSWNPRLQRRIRDYFDKRQEDGLSPPRIASDGSDNTVSISSIPGP